ncbi:MAG: signal peptidase II [Chloroflexi bacterium]|nr:signal peptidase II [Chloroflexota bacterium]
MKPLPKLLLVTAVLVISVGCDQVTKSAARTYLAETPTISLFGDLFRFYYTENAGAFLGLGANLPDVVRVWGLVGFTGAALLGMLLYILLTRDLKPAELLGWSLVIGGGFGNLIDRALYQGWVVDFMNVGVGRLRTGIFNVADVAIMVGLGIVLATQLSGHLSLTNSSPTPPPA